VQGRWSSPDAPFADQHLADPQSWNLYTYVRNRPTGFVDITGRETALFPLFDRGKMLAPGPNGDRVVTDGRTLGQKLIGDALIAGAVAVSIFAPEALPVVARAIGNGATACYLTPSCQQHVGEELKSAFNDDSPSLNAPAAKGTKLALGLQAYGLEQFARQSGSMTLFSFGTQWKSAFLDLMRRESVEVTFRLDGVDNALAAVQRASRGAGGQTDWELLQIYKNQDWWSRITWTLDGQVVENPFGH
jgi:hypothetical protein